MLGSESVYACTAVVINQNLFPVIVILRLFALYGRSFRVLSVLLPVYMLQLILGGVRRPILRLNLINNNGI